jgi:hypothetical protein
VKPDLADRADAAWTPEDRDLLFINLFSSETTKRKQRKKDRTENS